MTLSRTPLPLLLVVLATASPAHGGGMAKGELARVSVGPIGEEANGTSFFPSLSDDGRFVAFDSLATNLVADDTNVFRDVFVHDRKKGVNKLVSLSVSGAKADMACHSPAMSANGRYVTFLSTADLMEDGALFLLRAYVRDVKKKKTTLVSLRSDGSAISTHVSQPSISGNGRFVAFVTKANDVVPGDTAGTDDVFLHDRKTGQTVAVTRRPDGTPGGGDPSQASISKSGRFVAFDSTATDLVDGDGNGVRDVFVFDRKKKKVERVCVPYDSGEANGVSGNAPVSISADGRFVAFDSNASNLIPGDTNGKVDVFVFDRKKNLTTRVSESTDGVASNSLSSQPAISPDGRFVTFQSYATNLVSGDDEGEADVFLHDRKTRTTVRLSQSAAGVGADDTSGRTALSKKANYIAFESIASNLIPGVTNVKTDIFLRRR